MQSDIEIEDDAISGTLSYLDDETTELVGYWGPGHFLALNFADNDLDDYSSVMVGLDPSQGSGLVELKGDPDQNGVFKITDNESQVFKILCYVEGEEEPVSEQEFDLSNLVLEPEG